MSGANSRRAVHSAVVMHGRHDTCLLTALTCILITLALVQIGQYMLPRVQILGETPQCLSCPAGMECLLDGKLATRVGFWSVADASTGAVRALRCRPGYCAGASGDNATSMCAAGRLQPASENPLCGASFHAVLLRMPLF